MSVSIARAGVLAGVSGRDRERRAVAMDLAEAALAAVDAEAATRAALARVQGLRGCVVIAFGKASVPMARSALRRVAPRGGIVLALPEQVTDLGPLRVVAAGHPQPAPDAAARGAEVLALAQGLGADDVALVLVSGGGSAMLELPRPGVTLAEIDQTTKRLLAAGTPIAQLNAARGALSALKHGGLGRALAPARVVQVVLSDVPGLPLSLVASGPVGDGAQTLLAADTGTAIDAVVQAAARRGLRITRLPAFVDGRAADAGAALSARAREAFTADPGLDGLVGGGETTVVVTGGGRGGRNGEVVLGAAEGIGPHLLLSLATDGLDGTSDSAGGLVDAAARARGGDVRRALAGNDSRAWLSAAGTLLVTGATGTNVADVQIVLR